MPMEPLDVPQSVQDSPETLVGDIEKFMDSFNAGEQARFYKKAYDIAQAAFGNMVIREVRIMGGAPRCDPANRPYPRIPGCST